MRKGDGEMGAVRRISAWGDHMVAAFMSTTQAVALSSRADRRCVETERAALRIAMKLNEGGLDAGRKIEGKGRASESRPR